MWIIWIVAVIVVLVMLKFLFGNVHCRNETNSEADCSACGKSTDALDVLKKRFASGEIDEETFEKMKQMLEDKA